MIMLFAKKWAEYLKKSERNRKPRSSFGLVIFGLVAAYVVFFVI